MSSSWTTSSVSRGTSLPTSGTDLPVLLGAEQRADFAALPTEQLRSEALRHLNRIKRQPRRSQALKNHPTHGDLSDCRKIYFDESENVSPRWRIVFRLVPNAERPRAIEVVSIGRRRNAEVYAVALSRLGRH